MFRVSITDEELRLDDMHRGRIIAAIRVSRGLSRQDLANAANVSYPLLSSIENGTNPNVSITKIVDIARGLGTDIASIYRLAEDAKEKEKEKGEWD